MRSIACSLVAVSMAACVNTDTAVFVAPTITGTPTATVKSSVLGGSISGAFHVKLHLGARASGPSKVTLGEFSLVDAETKQAIFTLPVDAGATTFPATVEPDSDLDVDFTFDTGSKTLLTTDMVDSLCKPAPASVWIGGSIDDSLLGHATSFSSDVFQPSCM